MNLELMGFLRLTLQVEGKQLTLMELLQLCHSLKSTDPRDKVFALLGWPLMATASSEQTIASPLRSCTFILLFKFFELMRIWTSSVVCR